MIEHRPECIYTPQHFDPEQNIAWGGKQCICEPLRACEQRVENRIIHGGLDTARFNAGLDAAREAVAALDIGRDVRFSADVRADILAAIDALREGDK